MPTFGFPIANLISIFKHEENSVFYGAVFDGGDDGESPPITFVRGFNLERLAVEAFVDLANPKLIVRFQDSSATSAPGSAKGKAND
jgi:hypothetical protein